MENLKNGLGFSPPLIRANKQPLVRACGSDYHCLFRKSLFGFKVLDDIEGSYLFHKKRLIQDMSRIKAMINRYEPCLNSLAQIRASVITSWLKNYNLREVQYMAGHKYVSSIERYRTDNLEDLQKELEKYHPLK